jgi:tripartite ATP-independent transporter DctP family solute receptor
LVQTTLASSALTAAFIRTKPAKAADFTVKWAFNLPLDHPELIQAKAAVERIRAETGGKVVVQIFPSNQMGADGDLLNQIRTGVLDMTNLATSVLSTFVPNVALDGIGFCWNGYDTVMPAMDGAVGAYIRSELEKAGIFTMEKVWDLAFRQITTGSKPINGPEDLKDLRIRVPVSPMLTALFKSIGAAPTTVEWAETYTALQTKIVDAEENPLSIILTSKIYEVQKYCSITNHVWSGHWTLMSRRGWGRLPDDVKAVLTKHINQAALDERVELLKLEGEGRKLLTDKGMIFNDPDHESFHAALKKTSYYADCRGRLSKEAWDTLEKYVGNLG